MCSSQVNATASLPKNVLDLSAFTSLHLEDLSTDDVLHEFLELRMDLPDRMHLEEVKWEGLKRIAVRHSFQTCKFENPVLADDRHGIALDESRMLE